MQSLNRDRRIALLGLLLTLSLGVLAFTAIQTIQKIQSFQQHYHQVHTGDVQTVRPWMTIHAVSHIYNVPEPYLYQQLGVKSTPENRRDTLDTIAKKQNKPSDTVVHEVQHAILNYRHTHPSGTPPPQPQQTSKASTAYSGLAASRYGE